MIKNKQRIIRLTHKGSGGQKGWIYSIFGIISTLPASQYKDPSLIVVYDERNDNTNWRFAEKSSR